MFQILLNSRNPWTAKGAEGKEGCQLTAMPAEALAKVGCRLTAEKLAKFGSFVYNF